MNGTAHVPEKPIGPPLSADSFRADAALTHNAMPAEFAKTLVKESNRVHPTERLHKDFEAAAPELDRIGNDAAHAKTSPARRAVSSRMGAHG
jgi:hypothetical protein